MQRGNGPDRPARSRAAISPYDPDGEAWAEPPSLIGSVLQRARLDFVAGLVTLLAAAMCLGLTVMYFALSGQDMAVGQAKLGRWLASSLPVGGAVVFGLSFVRRTPWFAGIMASLVVWFVPMPTPMRLGVFLGLCVLLGALDAHFRGKARG